MRQCMDADNLHRRLKKIIGQVQAIDKMIDEDVPCEDVLAQINAAKSALHKAGQVVLEGHIKHCVRDVKLFPQGYSALALHPECVRDEPSVLLADIGGWTVDLMRLDNSVPNAATCRSLELGVIRCVDEITEQVRRNTGLSVTDIQIERVLNGQSCSMDPAAKEIIVRQGRLYTEKILSAIMEAGFDLKAIPSVIMGGGASILKRHVTPQDGLCRQIYLTDVHANASGYERIVGQMCAK